MSDADELPVAGTVVLLRARAVGVEVLLIRRPDRGSFAGAWVFPGGRVEAVDRWSGAAEQDDARRAGIRETFEEVGLTITGAVRALSRWQPPAEAPARIRTWFFLAEAPEAPLAPSPDEVADTAWVTPAEALARHGAGELLLYPPTWMTLHGLSRFASARAALDAAGTVRSFATRAERSDAGTAFVWDSLRLETGVLPWRLVDTDREDPGGREHGAS
ncbi:NUDIX domain-containing protein [Microbacterium sp. C5A9]|uniref:NUDIX hydrolase n=1 Tax=Microbacterium sp. C5A9 TaxID=2736663 RepID=UPI001F522328|nr:NUDIX domain-containing protein [Microbacterium sp. C5A9]MCI1017680.1 NUDIX domain-containing protein [Microbacterium sp. C5A9]